MKTPPKYYRQRKTVFKDFGLERIFKDEEIFIHKNQLLYDDWNFRPTAIVEVLRRIPQPDYFLLKSIAPCLKWIFEYSEFFTLGNTLRIPLENCQIKETSEEVFRYVIFIWLSVEIENSDNFDVAIEVIAHELAHAFFCGFSSLAYDLHGKVHLEEKRTEDLIRKWGFSRELKAKKIWEKRIQKERRVLRHQAGGGSEPKT